MPKKRKSIKRKKLGHPGNRAKISAEFDRAMDAFVSTPPLVEPDEKDGPQAVAGA